MADFQEASLPSSSFVMFSHLVRAVYWEIILSLASQSGWMHLDYTATYPQQILEREVQAGVRRISRKGRKLLLGYMLH